MDLHQLSGTPPSLRDLETGLDGKLKIADPGDLDYIMAIAEGAYARGSWDYAKAKDYLLACILSQAQGEHRVILGQSSVGILQVFEEPWNPGVRLGYIRFLFSLPHVKRTLEPFRVLKSLVEWAQGLGVVKIDYDSDPENPVNLAPFMKKLGAIERTGYTLYLEPSHEWIETT